MRRLQPASLLASIRSTATANGIPRAHLPHVHTSAYPKPLAREAVRGSLSSLIWTSARHENWSNRRHHLGLHAARCAAKLSWIRRALPMMLFFLLADGLCAALAVEDGRQIPNISAGAIFSATVVRCPFGFQHGMPPSVFCVYDGVVIGSNGQACGDRVMVIWTRLAPEFNADDGLDENVTGRSNVYFGFVTSPDLVMRADVDAAAESRATIVDYTLGHEQPRVRLRGTAELRFVPAGGGEGTEVLSLRIRRPVLVSGTCAFTSYDGTFVGVMTLPPDTTR